MSDKKVIFIGQDGRELTLAEAGEQEIVYVDVDDTTDLITVTVKEQG